MKCGNCGTKLSDDSVFCHECGSNVLAQAGQNVNANKAPKKGLMILLSVLIVLFGIVGSLIFQVHNATGKGAMEDLAEEMEWDKFKIGFLIKGEKKKTTLTEYIASGRERIFMMMGDLREDDIENLLEEKFVKKFLAEKASDYVQDVFTGNGKGKVKAKEIADLMEKNKKAIKDYIGWSLDDGNIEYVEDELRYMDIDEVTDLSELRDEYSTPFTLIRIFASKWLMAILLVLAVVMSVGIFGICDKKTIAFGYIGVNCMIIGGANMLVGLLTGVLASCMNDALPFGDDFWELVFAPVKNSGLLVGGIIVVVGVALFVIYSKAKKGSKAPACM